MKVSVEHIHKVYHDADRELSIIEDLSYSFPENSSVAILGRSGIGKSTLLHMLGGLETPTRGQVLFDGQDLYALDDEALSSFRGRHVGFIFQFHHLLPEFTAQENVAMPLIIAGQSQSDSLSQARQLLERVGLAERLSHRPGQLSGGEQQRVAIARALIGRPSVVLADEPTGNLDEQSGRSIQELLLTLTEENKALLVIVTHNLELARSLNIVLRMESGGHLRSEVQTVENALV